MERQIARLSRREILKSVGIVGAGLGILPIVSAFSNADHQGVGLKGGKAHAIPEGYVGTYVIYSLNSGLVLDVKGGSYQDGTPIIQYHYHGGANQQWNLVLQSNGYYVFYSVNSGSVLDVKGGSLQDGAPIIQYHYHNGLNQQWNLALQSNGYYVLYSVNSGLVMDVKGGSLQEGTPVIQYHYHGGANQQWNLV